MTGAAAASFLGTEPAAIVHSELPGGGGRRRGDRLADGAPRRSGSRSASGRASPGRCRGRPSSTPSASRRPWSCRRWTRGCLASWAHLALYHRRAPAPGGTDLAALRPVTDLMVTAVRTSALLTAAARQAAEQSLRAVQGEILRQISTAVLVDPALDRTLAAITEQLQQGAGYERVQVLLDPARAGGEPRRPDGPSSPWSRRDGSSARSSSRPAASSTRASGNCSGCSRSRSPSIVRNANLHRRALGGQVVPRRT